MFLIRCQKIIPKNKINKSFALKTSHNYELIDDTRIPPLAINFF